MTRNISFNTMLANMEIGQYHYIETTPDQYARLQTYCSVRTRWPEVLKDRKFQSSAWTAVGTKIGITRCLVRVERVA